MGETALLLIDAQVGLLAPPALDGEGVAARLADLLERARRAGAPVIFVQHDSDPGGSVEPGTPAWPLHPRLVPRPDEPVLHKKFCDAFYTGELGAALARVGAKRLVIGGCKTEFCIDTACRRATSLGFPVTLVSDGHTTSDAGGITAAQIIAHHHRILDGFGTYDAEVALHPASEITF